MAQMYDIAVLGTTPAGCAAAYHLAKLGLKVALVESPGAFNECPLMDWAPKEFFKLPGLPKGLAAAAKASSFDAVQYHDAKLARQVEYAPRVIAGYFLKTSNLIKALSSAAVKAGAKCFSMKNRPAMHLDEEIVRLLGSVQVTARMLLIAQGSPFDVLGDLAMPVRPATRSFFVSAALDIPLTHKAVAKKIGGALHVVELRERSEMGMFFLSEGVLHLRVISSSTATGTRAAELSSLVAGLQKADLLPADLALERAKGAVWYPPAGEALEMETHVAKRCMLVGTAGGFADTITGQTLAPSVRSAIIAADIAAASLDSADPQDALMKFKTEWRKSLAEYLRPPSTSLHMLLPLLFVNQRIVSKFTRALLYGENI